MPTQIGTMRPMGSLNPQTSIVMPRISSSPPQFITPNINSFPRSPDSLPIPLPQQRGVDSLPKQYSNPILIQQRPMVSNDIAPVYDSDQLTVVGPPNRSSYANNDAQTLSVINMVPKIVDVPAFVYLRDSSTGKIVRYLAQDESDMRYYDTDPNYGINQEWLLNNRQGDEQDRVPERTEFVEIADRERNNEQGYTTLNRGRIWYGAPRMNILPPSEAYEEYERLVEYAQTQIEEGDE